MNIKTKTIKNLLLVTVIIFTYLKSAVALADSNSSSLCPWTSSISAQMSSQSDQADSMFYRTFLAMQGEMDRLNQDVNHMTQEAFYAAEATGIAHKQLYPSVNMETTPKEYRVTMTVLGFDQKDLKVDVTADNTLTIRSEKNLVQKTSSGTEHSYGSFTQMLTLPPDADAAHIQTAYKEGEYTVILPRKEAGSKSSGSSEEQGRPL